MALQAFLLLSLAAGQADPPAPERRIGSSRLKSGILSDALAFLGDPPRLASGDADGRVRFWDLRDGRPRGIPLVHAGAVAALETSADGRLILTASADGTVRLWDAQGRETRRLPEHRGGATAAALSSDGGILLSGGRNGRLHVSGPSVPEPPAVREGIDAVALSLDGRHAAAAAGDRVIVWTIREGRVLLDRTLESAGPLSVAFSPDGRELASAGLDGLVRIWPLGVVGPPRSLAPDVGPLRAVTWSSTGRFLAAGGDRGRIWILDSRIGKPFPPLAAHEKSVRALRFSPDERWLASAGTDLSRRVWELATGQDILGVAGPFGQVHAISFSPSGDRLAAGNADGSVTLWDPATGRPLSALHGHLMAVRTLRFHPDGLRLISGGWDRSVRVWDLDLARERLCLKTDSAICSLAVSPDGQSLIAGTNDGKLRPWTTAEGGEEAAFDIGRGPILALDASPDGALVAAGRNDGSVLLLDAKTRKERSRLASGGGEILGLGFSPDGRRLAAVGDKGRVLGWEIPTGRPTFDVAVGKEALYAIDWSPDGTRIAVGGSEGTLLVLDSADGRRDRVLPAGSGPVLCLTFSPDGARLASGHEDSTIALWAWSAASSADAPRPALPLKDAWEALGAGEAHVAYEASLAMAAAPEESLRFLRSRLCAPDSERRLETLLQNLDDEDPAVRQKADDDLDAWAHLPELWRRLDDGRAPESRARLARFRERQSSARPTTSEGLRRLRAVSVLERLGTAAIQVLEEIAGGPDGARQTREARSSLVRLRR